MDRFRELTAFVAVAEEGAFNAAARRLGASPPAVTRLVGALEARLDVRLLTRTTRQVVLTETGAQLFADAARILDDLAEAEASAMGAHRAPRGVLRVTAPVEFGQRFIAPLLREFLETYPGVTAEALFVDRVVDIIGEGLDLAVRIGNLADSSMAAIRVGAVRRVAVAAPEYVARHGTPDAPRDLAAHRVIFHSGTGAAPVWEFVAGASREAVRLAPTLSVSTIQGALDASAAGFGITRILSYQVADALADGRLVEVLAEHETREQPIYLVHPEGRRAPAKVRAFVDLAAARLRARTTLVSGAGTGGAARP